MASSILEARFVISTPEQAERLSKEMLLSYKESKRNKKPCPKLSDIMATDEEIESFLQAVQERYDKKCIQK
jgi:hypothetical protein